MYRVLLQTWTNFIETGLDGLDGLYFIFFFFAYEFSKIVKFTHDGCHHPLSTETNRYRIHISAIATRTIGRAGFGTLWAQGERKKNWKKIRF